MKRKGRLDARDEEIARALRGRRLKMHEVKTATGLKYPVVRRKLAKLVKYRFVHHERYKYYELTTQGVEWLDALVPVPVEVHNKVLDPILKLLPTNAHRALFRLSVDVVIAKAHLAARHSAGWPCLIVWGDTKALKTVTGETLALLFRLDIEKVECVLYPGQVTPGNPGIRRQQKAGGEWTFAKSFHFDLPFVILDEFDKLVDKETRKSVSFLLREKSAFEVEGERIENRAVPYVTANLRGEDCRKNPFLRPYIRRGFVLDTDHVERSGGTGMDTIGRRMVEFSKSRGMPHIDLRKARPAVEELNGEECSLVEELLDEAVKPDCNNLIDALPVRLAVLGRTAQLGADVREAIFEVLFDRLTVFETLEGTKEGWRDRIYECWSKYRPVDQPEIQAKIEEARRHKEAQEEELARREEKLEQARVEKFRSQLDFERDKGDFIAFLTQLNEDLRNKPVGKRAKRETRGLRAVLKKTIGAAEGCRISKGLEELQLGVNPYIDQAQEVITTAQARRKEIETLEKEAKTVRALLKRQRTRSDERVLDKLLDLGCVEWQMLTWVEEVEPGEEARGAAIVGMGLTALAAGIKKVTEGVPFRETFVEATGTVGELLQPRKVTRKRKALVGIDGKEYLPSALSRWGSQGVNTLLEAKLTPIEQRLRELEAK